jgi:hypothetical protein
LAAVLRHLNAALGSCVEASQQTPTPIHTHEQSLGSCVKASQQDESACQSETRTQACECLAGIFRFTLGRCPRRRVCVASLPACGQAAPAGAGLWRPWLRAPPLVAGPGSCTVSVPPVAALSCSRMQPGPFPASLTASELVRQPPNAAFTCTHLRRARAVLHACG